MSATSLIRQLPAALKPEAARGADCTIQFNLSQPMYAVIKDGACVVADGTTPSSTVAVTMADEDFVELMLGRLDRVSAFMMGRLKVKGDLLLAQRLPDLFDAARLG
jgi:putative sterol carrier protein